MYNSFICFICCYQSRSKGSNFDNKSELVNKLHMPEIADKETKVDLTMIHAPILYFIVPDQSPW